MTKTKQVPPRRKEGRGYVYIMSYAPGVYKVGWTVDVHARRLVLQNQTLKGNVKYIKHWEFGDYSAMCIERCAHAMLVRFRTYKFGGYEIFKVNLDVIEAAIVVATAIIRKDKGLDLVTGLAEPMEQKEVKIAPFYIRGGREIPFYE